MYFNQFAVLKDAAISHSTFLQIQNKLAGVNFPVNWLACNLELLKHVIYPCLSVYHFGTPELSTGLVRVNEKLIYAVSHFHLHFGATGRESSSEGCNPSSGKFGNTQSKLNHESMYPCTEVQKIEPQFWKEKQEHLLLLFSSVGL